MAYWAEMRPERGFQIRSSHLKQWVPLTTTPEIQPHF